MPFADPERAKSYQRTYRRMRRAGENCTTPCTSLLPEEFRLDTARDVLELVGEQAEAVLNDDDIGTVERARTIGYLATILLRAIESGDMAARIEALEKALEARTKKGGK